MHRTNNRSATGGMDGELITLHGATGAALDFRIAGPGSRSYAFVIDWHFRTLAGIAWFAGAWLVGNGGLRWNPDTGTAGAAAANFASLPAIAIYFLYHPIVEILMRGQTPGKRIAGVRVIGRLGGAPDIGAILIRNAFRLIDSLPSFYVVGLLAAFLSPRRQRLGDMAAGTLLVLDQRSMHEASRAIQAEDGRPDASSIAADLATQILERWPALEPENRAAIARDLLARTGGPEAASRIAGMPQEALQAALAALSNQRGASAATRVARSPPS